jgi:hypothetical protein
MTSDTPGGFDPGSAAAPDPGARPAPVAESAPGTKHEDLGLGVAVSASGGQVVTARRAGQLRDLALPVDPGVVGVRGALQNLAKAINVAFQHDFGENYLESVYQAAVMLRGEVRVVHREYFGLGQGWFRNFGMLLRSLQLTLRGPDPASPEGIQRFQERGASSIRGLLSLFGRKLDIVPEFEDRVPAYVEQMMDRLEASGIIVGWDRADWQISTTGIGLDIRIIPRPEPAAEQQPVPRDPTPTP